MLTAEQVCTGDLMQCSSVLNPGTVQLVLLVDSSLLLSTKIGKGVAD